MKKYIQYAKAKCAPRLSEEAGQVLASAYVKIRDDVRRQSASLQVRESMWNQRPKLKYECNL